MIRVEQLIQLNQLAEANQKAIAIIFEGRDSAGKSGTIKRVTEYMPPEKYRVELSPKPSKGMMKKWFSSYKKKLPKKGEIVFFDRSHYSRALVQPVNGWCSKGQYRYFMGKVLDWESSQDVIFIKIWCSISRAEQAARLTDRKTSPLKYWKFSANDKASLSHYDKITLLKEEIFNSCGEWQSIDFNDKQLGQKLALDHIIEAIEYSEYDKHDNL